MPQANFDFSGYATKNDLKCTDGRTILRDAFKHQDGINVPLVWQHLHDQPANVLGHATLENREDGVYVYGYLNDSEEAQNAKTLLSHRDIESLSIYANQLIEKSKRVVHGVIREVSLVLAGANPGAKIDYVAVQHGDGAITELDDEAIIYTGLTLEHAAEETVENDSEETIGEVLDTLSDKQRTAMYAVIGQLMEVGDIEHSAEDDSDSEIETEETEETQIEEGDSENIMKHNAFADAATQVRSAVLTHSDVQTILINGKKMGSLRDAFFAHVDTLPEDKQALIHATTYGIGSDRDNLELLFPDAQNVTAEPTWIARQMGWVKSVLNGTRHSPFSRIKSLHADITADEARAKGYVTGAEKTEEVFPVLKRVTTPTTIYKKQKLDRDDIIDITDFNVVAWLKREMRLMLDEEIARAVLVGDGRSGASADKISETEIRPIWTDAAVYVHHEQVVVGHDADDLIDDLITARTNYRGTGNPDLFVAPSLLTAWLLLKDGDGRRLYRSVGELAAELRVSSIVEVPVMEGLERTDTVDYDLMAIMVNLADYTIGADKGGEVNMFDDFDIDYNQQKYLIETRISGALTVPKSAIVLERAQA